MANASALRERAASRMPSHPRWALIRAWMPPVERREFWAVQVLVLLIAVLHTWVELALFLGENSPLYLVPTTLFIIPTVYAAVSFGTRGAALTALWCGVLAVLNLVMFHEGLERIGELVQVVWISAVAIFVGSRVDRERASRHEAERRGLAWRASEGRYRSIIDNVDEPIMLLDEDRAVLEANRSAADLLDQDIDALRGHRLPGNTGERIERMLITSGPRVKTDEPVCFGEPARWYRAVSLVSPGQAGADVTQLVLRDVTTCYEREQGLESIVREALADREEEHRRIARELHDGPLQSLVQLWRGLDSVSDVVPEPRRASVVAARDTAAQVTDELRRFSRDLRPSVLDDLGISAAIRSEAESLEQRAAIAVAVRVLGKSHRLDGDVELGLLRITQEAVRNIERHSQASNVTILLEFDPAQVRLVISDDGVGLDPVPTTSQLLAQHHLGLIGMQERARLAGGRLEFHSGPGQGLTVEVVLRGDEVPH